VTQLIALVSRVVKKVALQEMLVLERQAQVIERPVYSGHQIEILATRSLMLANPIFVYSEI
jgi:hypothetical protein